MRPQILAQPVFGKGFRVKRLIFILFITLTCFYDKLNASIVYNYPVRKAFSLLTDLNYSKADAYIQLAASAKPENKAVYTVLHFKQCLQLILIEDKKEYKATEETLDQYETEIASDPEQSALKNYCLADMYLHRAFLKFRFGDYFSGMKAINKSYRILTANELKYPNFVLNKKGLGLLHALIGLVPNEYQWALKLAGFSGSLNTGLAELETVYRASETDTAYNYCMPEVRLINALLNANFNQGNRFLDTLLQDINNSGTANLFDLFSFCNIKMHQGKSSEALSKLQSAQHLNLFPYLYYLRGLCRLYCLDLRGKEDFEQFCKFFKGNSFVKSAWHKLFWIAYLKNDKEKMDFYSQQVINKGSDDTDEDRQALADIKSSNLPDVNLLKSRLLFDGGYYPQAIKVLLKSQTTQFKTVKEQLEFVYRLARIHHKTGNFNKALYYYDLTIKNGTPYPYYFAANAALNAGQVCEERSDYNKAANYYQKCLATQNKEYRNSIEQKAKAGLQRLKKK